MDDNLFVLAGSFLLMTVVVTTSSSSVSFPDDDTEDDPDGTASVVDIGNGLDSISSLLQTIGWARSRKTWYW